MTLVFLTTRGVLSRLIRWATNSAASHVAIGVDLAGVPLLLQADIGGVQTTLRERFIQRGHVVVAEYECATLPPIALAGAVSCIGEHYDYVGLLGYAFVMLGRHFGRKVRNPLASSKATVCSEFVLSLDPRGEHVPDWATLAADRTSPEDLLQVCRSRADLFTKL